MSFGGRLAIAIVSLAVLGVLGAGVAFWLQGYRVYVVHTGSMSPTYRPGDVVIDGPADHGVQTGQVITFRHSDLTTDVVTHRVVKASAAGITTKGDANRTADAWTIRPDQVTGHVLFGVQDLGYVVVFLRQPSGIGSIATAAIALVLLWRLFFPAVEDSRRDPDNMDSADDACEATTKAELVLV